MNAPPERGRDCPWVGDKDSATMGSSFVPRRSGRGRLDVDRAGRAEQGSTEPRAPRGCRAGPPARASTVALRDGPDETDSREPRRDRRQHEPAQPRPRRVRRGPGALHAATTPSRPRRRENAGGRTTVNARFSGRRSADRPAVSFARFPNARRDSSQSAEVSRAQATRRLGPTCYRPRGVDFSHPRAPARGP